MANRTEDVIHYIMREIRSGIYLAGSKLCSQMALTRKLNCSRTTVERAIARLTAAGILESRRGSGTYICDFQTAAPVTEVTVITGAVDHSLRTSFVDMFLDLDPAGLPVRWGCVRAGRCRSPTKWRSSPRSASAASGRRRRWR